MQFQVCTRDSLDDGWTEAESLPSNSHLLRCTQLEVGDTVLYKAGKQRTPAVLVETAGGSCWLARDARHRQHLIYLGAENIVARLPRMDLLEEAA